ncbi:hypothetical protein H6A07_04565 [Olsenella uli]|uniref:hypothetical protein n=1 Tax=Olsenella uli TaxID=133926 RepID=UPI0019587553|nr:hypothetical protein [Olsenella uli]MBM6676013.1 hypothetical protein [Olsenella uli]
MSKKVGGAVLLAGLVVGAGVAAYRLLLTSEAKAALRDSFDEVRHAVETLNETLVERQNNEEATRANQQRTREMWSALGY